MRTRRKLTLMVALLSGAAWNAAYATPTITPLVVDDEPVIGYGEVLRPWKLAINNNGSWLVQASTLHNSTRYELILHNGDVLYRDAGIDPNLNVAIDIFEDMDLNNNGDVMVQVWRSGFPSYEGGAIYVNHAHQFNTLDAAPPPFSAAATVRSQFNSQINDSGYLLIGGQVRETQPTSDYVSLYMTMQPTNQVLSTIVSERTVLPQTSPDALDSLSFEQHAAVFNNANQVLYRAQLTGSGDKALYRYQAGTHTLLLRNGDPSPDGTNFIISLGSAMDMNNHGDYATLAGKYRPAYSESTEVVIVNGQVVYETGQAVGTVGPEPLLYFGTSPLALQIDDYGNLLWYGELDAQVRRKILFRNDEVVVECGVTQLLGSTVQSITTDEWGVRLSDNGRYAAFIAELADGRRGVFMVDFGPVPEPGTLALLGLGGLAMFRRHRPG